MEINDDKLKKIITEELSKNDVRAIMNDKFDNFLDGREFKSHVRNIVADVLDEFFQNLWMKKSFWKGMIRR